MSKKLAYNVGAEKNDYDKVALILMRNLFIDKKLKGRIDKKGGLTLYLGNLLILENLISYKLSHLIRIRQNYINENLRLKKMHLKVDDPIDLLSSSKTLGGLICIYEKYYKIDSVLANKLEKFNSARNDITHFMHLGFHNLKEVRKKAKTLCDIGKDIIVKMDKETRDSSIIAIKNIKIPKVLSLKTFSEQTSAKFQDPFDAKTNYKIYNKRKKKK